MFRRLAHSLANNDLDASIAEQKAFNEVSKKLLEADMKGHESLFKWAQSEKNPVFRDLFERSLQLTHIRFDAYQTFIAKMREARQHFKIISKEEKKIEDVRKNHANVCTRLSRLKKQIDTATKKNDLNKIESLLPELQSVLMLNDQATCNLEEQVEGQEVFKVKCLRDALRLQAEAYQLLGSYWTHMSQAQHSLADLIPDDPPNISAINSYRDGPRRSTLVIDDLCQTLGIHTPSKDRFSSFIVVDSADASSPSSASTTIATDLGTSPPGSTAKLPPAPTGRPPLLPPPRPANQPEYLPLTSQVRTSIYSETDDGDYVAYEDVEAERRRVLQNAAADASGRPRLAPRPKAEKVEAVLKERGNVPHTHYTLPRGGGAPQMQSDEFLYEVVPVQSPSAVPQLQSPPTGPRDSATTTNGVEGRSPIAVPTSSDTSTSSYTPPTAGKATPSSSSQPVSSDGSAYQDPTDAYLWLWPKSKGQPSVAGNEQLADGEYQRPWEVVAKEEQSQKVKSQCMRRSVRRSPSSSPPQVSRNDVRPSPPQSTANLVEDDSSAEEHGKKRHSLSTTLKRTSVSLRKSKRLQASLTPGPEYQNVDPEQRRARTRRADNSSDGDHDNAGDNHVGNVHDSDVENDDEDFLYSTVPTVQSIAAGLVECDTHVYDHPPVPGRADLVGADVSFRVSPQSDDRQPTTALSTSQSDDMQPSTTAGEDTAAEQPDTDETKQEQAVHARQRQRLSAMTRESFSGNVPTSGSPLTVRKRSAPTIAPYDPTSRSARLFDT